MKNKMISLFVIGAIIPVVLTACQKNTDTSLPNEPTKPSYSGENLYFRSSNNKMNEFLNDFTHRHMRYDEYRLADFMVTHGTGFAKNWETMASAFQNSSVDVYGEDLFANLKNYFLNADQDELGLVYNTNTFFEPYGSDPGFDDTLYTVPQGWPFPTWKSSVDNFEDYSYSGDNVTSCHTTTFEFNGSYYIQSLNWQAVNGEFHATDTQIEDAAQFASNDSVSAGSSYMFYKDDLVKIVGGNGSYPNYGGIDTRCAPMVEVDIEFTGHNVEDYNIIWKCVGDDSWHRASQKLYSSVYQDNFEGRHRFRQFLNLSLCAEWNRKRLSAIGIEFVGKEGKSFSVKDGIINYIRTSYDTRQSNATYQLILAVYNYFIQTRDIELLARLMPKLRKATLFLTHSLEGEKGLLNVGYLYGHDGIPAYSFENNRIPYHGIGNGYWDLTVTPMFNLESNVYFYQALKAMSVMEEAIANNEIIIPQVEVKNRIPGESNITYSFDKHSLFALAEEVKTNIQKPISSKRNDNIDWTYSAGDYYYEHQGGFYNPETGRFALGINENTGEIIDPGYLYHNLEAVCADIPTNEQQLSIMNWIDGKRIVQGDLSTGSDIYFYEFAPRMSTKDTDMYFNFAKDENHYARYYSKGFGSWSRQVQNGGAIIAWSYYDLVARAKVLGIDNAMKRLDAMKTWYHKILSAGGSGSRFYKKYYSDLNAKMTSTPEGREKYYYIYSVQGSAEGGPGAMGLDAEFIENIILIKAIPDALFGMDANGYNNLTFTCNNLSQKYFEIYNMKYHDAIYSLRNSKNTIEVFNISGICSQNDHLTFKYKTDKSELRVRVNGEVFTNAKYENGYLIVEVPFDNVKVIFG